MFNVTSLVTHAVRRVMESRGQRKECFAAHMRPISSSVLRGAQRDSEPGAVRDSLLDFFQCPWAANIGSSNTWLA
jgi:hypothetical protein